MQWSVSMKRINDFLVSEEVDEDMIEYTPDSWDSEFSVNIWDANFHWGFKKQGDDELELEKQKIKNYG